MRVSKKNKPKLIKKLSLEKMRGFTYHYIDLDFNTRLIHSKANEFAQETYYMILKGKEGFLEEISSNLFEKILQNYEIIEEG